MKPNEFITKLLAAAGEAGFSVAEAYLAEEDSFEATAMDGEIKEYSSHSTRGLGLRALLNGRMGYAFTEALDEAAVEQLIRGAKDSALYCEDESEQLIYDGCEPVAELSLTGEDAPVEQKLAFALQMEQAAKDTDPRIKQVGYDTVLTKRAQVRIVNTHGMDKQYALNMSGAYLAPVAREDALTSTGFEIKYARDFSALSAKELGEAAARRAVAMLGASPVPSGCYRVILENRPMADILETFAGAFSAENAQQSLSRLQGKLGEAVAAPCVTIVDDPLRADAMGARPFDAEGVPSRRNAVVEGGVFKTFLHNLKTARKDGVASTGNASKAGYAATVRVAPTNFYIEPGKKSLAELMAEVGEGLLITEVEGLNAGANDISGDFSLSSKGFVIRGGVKGRAVEQITIAGNFFDLLKAVQALGADLLFPSGGIGAPSVDVGTLSVAGRSEGDA